MQEQLSTAQKTINTIIEFCIHYSFEILGAFLVLILGFVVAGWAAKLAFSFFQKKKFDITLSRFLSDCLRIIIVAFTVIIALGKFGITIAPFVAALSAVAFGASLAIQGPLSNYGAGIGIILSRPFVVGNTITVCGVSGIVEEVKLACTVLRNEDGVQITIPNKEISGQILHNSRANKLSEGIIGISYQDQPEKAIEIIQEVLKRFPQVIQDPKPHAGISAFADSSINIEYRYWIPTAEYFPITYAVNLAILNSFNQAGITIPYPQREIRVLSQSSQSLS